MTCSKVKYPDRQFAMARLRRARDDGQGGGHVYRCDRCQEWHVTHYTKAEWRRIRRAQ